MLTSMKSCLLQRYPLKFCVNKNVTALVNLFVNFRPNRNRNCRGLDYLITPIDNLIRLRESQEVASTNCMSRWQHGHCRWRYRVRRTDRRLTAVFDRSVVKLVNDAHVCTFWTQILIFWFVLFVLSILVSVNLIDINTWALILREMCYVCVWDFHVVR